MLVKLTPGLQGFCPFEESIEPEARANGILSQQGVRNKRRFRCLEKEEKIGQKLCVCVCVVGTILENFSQFLLQCTNL